MTRGRKYMYLCRGRFPRENYSTTYLSTVTNLLGWALNHDLKRKGVVPRGWIDENNGSGSHLDLYGEEEGRGEGVNGSDAGDRAGLSIWIPGFQVPVSKGQQPPDHGKEHP